MALSRRRPACYAVRTDKRASQVSEPSQVNELTAKARGPAPASSGPAPLIDPRLGDFESDHAAPKQRSLLAIAGSLLSEISLTKLAVTWAIQILAPAVLLGLAPLILTAWIGEASNRFYEASEIGAILVVIVAAAAAVYGWRPLFRLAESNFWSLNALAVQPGYAFWREAIRHLAERSFGGRTGPRARVDARGELRGGGRASVRRRGAGRLGSPGR